MLLSISINKYFIFYKNISAFNIVFTSTTSFNPTKQINNNKNDRNNIEDFVNSDGSSYKKAEILLNNNINPASFEVNNGMRKYVTLSVSFEPEMAKDYYIFYLPVTCQAWRRIGYEPIIILVMPDTNEKFVDINKLLRNIPFEDENETNKPFQASLNPVQLKVIEYLNLLKVKIFYLKSLRKYEVEIAMVSRIFIGYIGQHYIGINNRQFIIYLPKIIGYLSKLKPISQII